MILPIDTNAGEPASRRLFVYNAGFLRDRRLRRILALAGWSLRTGWPQATDTVGVWGASPTAHRGLWVARKTGARVLRIEDAPLRSLFPGRAGEPPLGLILDAHGIHFDAREPSALERHLRTAPLDDAADLARAEDAIHRIRRAHLTKYAAVRTDLTPPDPGYVLVIDQVRGDASVRASGGDRARFLEMLTAARLNHPGARIVIRGHPEAAQGRRPGHLVPSDCREGDLWHDAPLSPWLLLDGAQAVYTLSSQMGFEAILAGHRPHVFGTPFYAGWGLSTDHADLPHRTRRLTRAQLFAAAMLHYPVWYDPYRDRLCELEDAIATLEAQARALRDDRAGWIATGMRLWKRPTLRAFFGKPAGIRFVDPPQAAARAARDTGRRLMTWSDTAVPDADPVRVEDGFLRSRGLGAELVAPLSYALDPAGLYFDPRRPSTLDQLIAAHQALRASEIERSERLIAQMVANNLTKYNQSANLSLDLPAGAILVVGQVEDDASIRLGASEIRTNAALLQAARAANPNAALVWKPHPDVEAGLRPGAVVAPEQWADMTVRDADIGALFAQVAGLWTITSLAGFEALLRGVPVTTLGAPFYAGWGLTRDLGPVPPWRKTGPPPSLAALVHATLIAYPRYHDPVTNLPCPVEVIVDRLADGAALPRQPVNRLMAKGQGLLATWGLHPRR